MSISNTWYARWIGEPQSQRHPSTSHRLRPRLNAFAKPTVGSADHVFLHLPAGVGSAPLAEARQARMSGVFVKVFPHARLVVGSAKGYETHALSLPRSIICLVRKMQIVLVMPAAERFCPYVMPYVEYIGRSTGSEPILLEWDRIGCHADGENVYYDRPSASPRGLLEYMSYALFVKKKLQKIKPDKVVVFGLPLLMALVYAGGLGRLKYAVDIRDYHKTYRVPFVRAALNKASMVAISSPGFMDWLDTTAPIGISHNASILMQAGISNPIVRLSNQGVVVSTIGALKDLSVNLELIQGLSNCDRIEIHYHGLGAINDDLKSYVRDNGIKNVKISGYYDRSSEHHLYREASYISMLMSNESINNQTLMSNRIYNATAYGRPLLALRGSYLARMIDRYGLGVTFRDVQDLCEALKSGIYNDFDWAEYEVGRADFYKMVASDNAAFQSMFDQFVNGLEYT